MKLKLHKVLAVFAILVTFNLVAGSLFTVFASISSIETDSEVPVSFPVDEPTASYPTNNDNGNTDQSPASYPSNNDNQPPASYPTETPGGSDQTPESYPVPPT